MHVGQSVIAGIKIKTPWRGKNLVRFEATIIRFFKNGNMLVVTNKPIKPTIDYLNFWPVERKNVKESNHKISPEAQEFLNDYLKSHPKEKMNYEKNVLTVR